MPRVVDHVNANSWGSLLRSATSAARRPLCLSVAYLFLSPLIWTVWRPSRGHHYYCCCCLCYVVSHSYVAFSGSTRNRRQSATGICTRLQTLSRRGRQPFFLSYIYFVFFDRCVRVCACAKFNILNSSRAYEVAHLDR